MGTPILTSMCVSIYLSGAIYIFYLALMVGWIALVRWDGADGRRGRLPFAAQRRQHPEPAGGRAAALRLVARAAGHDALQGLLRPRCARSLCMSLEHDNLIRNTNNNDTLIVIYEQVKRAPSRCSR